MRPQGCRARMDPRDTSARRHDDVGQCDHPRHEEASQHHGSARVEKLPDNPHALEAGRDRGMGIDEATHLHDVDGSLPNEPAECRNLSRKACQEPHLEERSRHRAEPVEWERHDVHRCSAETLGGVSGFVREHDHCRHTARGQWLREAQGLVLGTAEEGVVDDVEDVHLEAMTARTTTKELSVGPPYMPERVTGATVADTHQVEPPRTPRRQTETAALSQASGKGVRPHRGGIAG